jgi:hypothetical protein
MSMTASLNVLFCISVIAIKLASNGAESSGRILLEQVSRTGCGGEKGGSMNEKPDNFLRLLLIVIVLLLGAHFCVQFFFPAGRYVQLESESQLVVLDTRTGTIYAVNKETKTVMELNICGASEKAEGARTMTEMEKAIPKGTSNVQSERSFSGSARPGVY